MKRRVIAIALTVPVFYLVTFGVLVGVTAVHAKSYAMVRQMADETLRGIGILADLQGPKIRLARFKDGPHELARGDIFTITTDEVEGTGEDRELGHVEAQGADRDDEADDDHRVVHRG